MFRVQLEAVLGAIVGAVLGWVAMEAYRTQPGNLLWFPLAYQAAITLCALAGFLLANAISVRRSVTYGNTSDRNAALQMTPKYNQALIYFIRAGRIAANGVIDLQADNRTIAFVAGHQFTAFQLAPGHHIIEAIFTRKAGHQVPSATVSIELKPGVSIALVHRVKFGWARASVAIVAEPVEIARARLSALSFAVPKT